jgi:hypothetical protein
MKDALNIIYSKVEASLKLNKEIDDMVKTVKENQNFHKIASDDIPDDQKKGYVGHEFLAILFGKNKANDWLIRSSEINSMRKGDGV